MKTANEFHVREPQKTWSLPRQRYPQEVEILPLAPNDRSWVRPSPAAIYVLRRPYLRPEHEVRERFDTLTQEWEREAFHVASPTQAAMHPAYQRIIGLGLQAVPLLLDSLRSTKRSWFWALAAITHENPAQGLESASEATSAWLAWGQEQGYWEP